MSDAGAAQRDRLRGALLGLAVGDAVGTTVEFEPPGSFAPVADMVGGGPFGLAAGEWTDDTSMALCLAESLVHCNGFDAADQMDRYCRWRDDGYLSSNGVCFDIGGTVSAALAAQPARRPAGPGSLPAPTPALRPRLLERPALGPRRCRSRGRRPRKR